MAICIRKKRSVYCGVLSEKEELSDTNNCSFKKKNGTLGALLVVCRETV